MSTTEQRTGFRLPWSTDARAPDGEAEAAEAPPTEAAATDAAATATDAADNATDATATDATGTYAPAPEAEAAEAASASDSAEPEAGSTEMSDGGEEMSWPEVDRRIRQSGRRTSDATPARRAAGRGGVSSTEVPRRANTLMAELSKAMHAAAESARTETLEYLAADANARIEAIRSGSADEAANIKQTADRDMAAARDWSKAELARIREETERRIGARRAELEREVEAHTAQVERRIDRVRRTVAGFETQMASFFETLLAEEDPTQVAFLAEQMPEAPSLEVDDELEDAFDAFEADADVVAPTESVAVEDVAVEDVAAEDVAAEDVAAEDVAAEDVAGEIPAIDDDPLIGDAELSAEGAAAAEAEALASLETDLPAEAAEDTASDGTTDLPAMPEEVIAARLAKMDTEAPSTAKTELIVTGLVSVAGIAGFKRAVSRITGVSAVGVTSGPGGEFVYAVTHGPETDFNSAISALPGFAARLTGESEGVIRVTATDRDADR